MTAATKVATTGRVNARAIALPAWLDLNLLVVLLLAALAAWPLLTRPSLVTVTDAQQHAYRVYELMQGWRGGVPYPRWAADFYYGFGYPVFNFYAVLSYYLAGAYGLLFGPVAGVKFVLVLAEFLGPVGVYLFVRDRWSGAAGLVAAAVYAFAPYIVLVNPIMRGAMPEALATALAPLVFWTWTRLAQVDGRRWWLPATLSLAALLLAHNLMPFVYGALLLAWLGWDLLISERRVSFRAALGRAPWLVSAGLALLVALGLTSFMWLTALLDRGTVQYQNAFAAALDRRFVTWAELFAPMTRADLEPPGIADYVYRLGLAQWVLGALGALTLLRPTPQRRATLFWLLVTAAGLLVMVPQSSGLWAAFTPLHYLQFSFRLLGVTALGLAILAGALVEWVRVERPTLTPALAAGIVAVTVAFGLPLLNPLPWPEFPPITPKAILDFEISGVAGVGTTWQGEFLPIYVKAVPAPVPDLSAMIAAGTVDKLDRGALPAGVTVTNTAHLSERDNWLIDTPVDFTLQVFTFYWGGWAAYVDNVKVDILPTDPGGWIAFRVPAGQHTIRVELLETKRRLLGWMISDGSVLLLLAGAYVSLRRQSTPDTAQATAPPGLATGGLVLLVVAVGLVARYALDAGIRWQAAKALPSVPAAQFQAGVVFDNQAALAAYDLPTTTAHPGDPVLVTFYWLMRAHTEAPASVFVHVYGPDGALWGQSDKPDPVLFFPTTRWPLGRVMADAHTVQLKPDAPPGTYRLAVGLWDRATGRRSHPLGADGQPLPEDVYTLTDQFTLAP